MANEPKQVVKKMSAKEFRELGYLQELNRCFLHPLGLALEVTQEGGEITGFGEVWDYRHDPEGMVFADGVIDPEKADRIQKEFRHRANARVQRLGYQIQPPK